MPLYAKVLDGEAIEFEHKASISDQSNLPPHKPRWLPVVDEDVPFDPVTQVQLPKQEGVENGQWVRRLPVRQKNEGEIASMREEVVERIHDEAQARVNLHFAGSRNARMQKVLFRQLFILMRVVKLLSKGAANLTAAERTEIQNLVNQFDKVQEIRAKINAKEAEVQAIPDNPTAISSYNPSTGWE